MRYVISAFFLLLCASLLSAQDAVKTFYPEGIKESIAQFKQSFAEDVVTPRLERWKTDRHSMSLEMSEAGNYAPLLYKTGKKNARSYYLIEGVEKDGQLRCVPVAYKYRESLVKLGGSDAYDLSEFDPLAIAQLYDYRFYASASAPDYEKLVAFAAMLYRDYSKSPEAELFGNAVLSYYALRDPSLRESVSSVISELSDWKDGAKLDYVTFGENLRWRLLLPEGDEKARSVYEKVWQAWCEQEIAILTQQIKDAITYKSGVTLGMLRQRLQALLVGREEEKEAERAPWIAGSEVLATHQKKYDKARKDKDRKKYFTFWRKEVERRSEQAGEIRTQAHKLFDELEAKIVGIDYGKPKDWNKVVELFQKLTGDDQKRLGGLDPNLGHDYNYLARALYYASKPVNEFLGCGYPLVAKQAIEAMEIAKLYYPRSRNSIYLKMKMHLMLSEFKEAHAELDLIEKNEVDFTAEDRETAAKWRVRITQAELKDLGPPVGGSE